jgi:hypothetical protein
MSFTGVFDLLVRGHRDGIDDHAALDRLTFSTSPACLSIRHVLVMIRCHPAARWRSPGATRSPYPSQELTIGTFKLNADWSAWYWFEPRWAGHVRFERNDQDVVERCTPSPAIFLIDQTLTPWHFLNFFPLPHGQGSFVRPLELSRLPDAVLLAVPLVLL